MNSILIEPQNKVLKKYIQYFLFFRKTNSEFESYTTFPNNNLCLAIYKQNNICYSKENGNKCIISDYNHTAIKSKLLGFHQKPFKVEIESELDQVCIIFQPASLKIFTNEAYENLLNADNVFNEIFKDKDSNLARIFELIDHKDRALELEKILFRSLNHSISNKMEEALFLIHQKKNLSVETLAKKLLISDVTLFRLFKNHLGQNPKSYLKTIRFRNVLNDILNSNLTLTEIAYQNQYFDQSHFIKDFKSFAGICPNVISDNISVRQEQLLWIYNNK